MIDMDAMLPWLDLLEPTRLSVVDRSELEKLKPLAIPDSRFSVDLDSLLTRIRSSGDDPAYGEALVRGGIMHFNRGQRVSALQYLSQSLDLLKSGTYRYAISAYLLGWLKYDIDDVDMAQRYWEISLKSFEFYGKWFITQYNQMNDDIRIAKTNTIEEVHFWLNKWEQTAMIGQVLQLVEIIRRKARRKDQTIYAVLDQLGYLLGRKVDFSVEAEGYFECGSAAYQMENYLMAISFFVKSSDTYHPATHRQAVALWALGLSQFQLTQEKLKGISNWERAIVIFEELAMVEGRRNRQDKMEWYEETLRFMRTALSQRS